MAAEQASDNNRRLLKQVAALPARTLDGSRVKAWGVRCIYQPDTVTLDELYGGIPGQEATLDLKLIYGAVVDLLVMPGENQDADLVAACDEFRAQEAYGEIYENRDNNDDEANRLAKPISAAWDRLLDRMAALRTTTSEGLAARALALSQHSGIKPG